MGNNNVACIAGLGVLVATCWITVAARMYVRQCLMKTVDLGDWLMVVATCGVTAIAGNVIYMITLGFGEMSVEATENTSRILMMYYVCELIYTVSVAALKSSIALLLLRFTLQPTPRRIVKWTTMCYLIYSVVFFVILNFQCLPIIGFWDSSRRDKCLPKALVLSAIYFHATISLVTDGIFALLPMYLVWNIQMSRRTKASICTVLGLGLTTAAVNIARFFFIGSYRDGKDTYSMYELGITSELEVGIGITAASLATLRPLLRLLCKSWGLPSSKGATEKADRSTTLAGGEDYLGVSRSFRPNQSILDIEVALHGLEGEELAECENTKSKESVATASTPGLKDPSPGIIEVEP